MDEFYTVSILLDFYGQMVTKRQYDILDLYYNSDYSLGEIAEELNISRQGVHDSIKRGKAALFDMEEKLGLVSRFARQKDIAAKIFKLIDDVDTSQLSVQDKCRLKDAREQTQRLLED
jgi:predicted DNA-binding protein YlxM (UPF0122 family)